MQPILEQVAKEAAAPVQLKINAMKEKINAIKQILEIDERKTFSDHQMKQSSKDTRAVAKIQFAKWQQDYEKALADIRPFDESMLVPKKSNKNYLKKLR